jgi:hypothetical protein
VRQVALCNRAARRPDKLFLIIYGIILGVLHDKIGRLRVEIANVQELNQQFRSGGGNGTDVQVAHEQRNERLQAIQHELMKLADVGRPGCFDGTDEGKVPLSIVSHQTEESGVVFSSG